MRLVQEAGLDRPAVQLRSQMTTKHYVLVKGSKTAQMRTRVMGMCGGSVVKARLRLLRLLLSQFLPLPLPQHLPLPPLLLPLLPPRLQRRQRQHQLLTLLGRRTMVLLAIPMRALVRPLALRAPQKPLVSQANGVASFPVFFAALPSPTPHLHQALHQHQHQPQPLLLLLLLSQVV